MTHREIMARLGEIFRDVFDDDGIVLSDSTPSADIDGWDSIMHITLIGEVESAFSVHFSMKQVLSMQNVGELADTIEALLR